MKKKYLKKIIFHQMRQLNFMGRGDFGGRSERGNNQNFILGRRLIVTCIIFTPF
jgi:hypothetical protein